MLDETMDHPLGVDLWIDLGSLGCYLTLSSLRRALDGSRLRATTQLIVHPFFSEQALDEPDSLRTLAADLGIRLADEVSAADSTALAWRLLTFAQQMDYEKGRALGPDMLHLRLAEALMRARFELGLSLEDENVLVGVGQDVGIPAEAALEALGSVAMDDIVAEANNLALYLGISSVPVILLDEHFVADGCQLPESYGNILATVLGQRGVDGE